ncbi:hypothetical protein RRG08_017555 [Elysia crispata]|uniref:Uncharacterized protein n=1 Tax=Elysia crispata TaxID=231223 RepID=A0AAE1ABC8_9GAST|nr:hypothetical protein RRG08_017555 [Elysia crispata]
MLAMNSKESMSYAESENKLKKSAVASGTGQLLRGKYAHNKAPMLSAAQRAGALRGSRRTHVWLTPERGKD